mmetsp:Transcript_18304/g.42771  ORF Transcript_18304/g.42771 Transcript_18304/m.42771 type:complete len:123 (+) Transcript_18304:260-628(+)
MKDKKRVTLMVCTGANGDKVPWLLLDLLQTQCASFFVTSPTLPYTNQRKAWFDKNVTVWWINEVFSPYVYDKRGRSPLVLLLDNCSAHKIDQSLIAMTNIHIHFLSLNTTSVHQPADMGMIA